MRTLLRPSLLALSIGFLALAGCAEEVETTEPTEPEESVMTDEATPATAGTMALSPALAGTRWQLVEFQSMDDTTMQPEGDALYTLDLGADGQAAMQLNCNQGTGSWSAEAGAAVGDGGETGTIEFGTLAVTQMACPPPSMDEKVANDMQYVRGYVLRDGQLSLSLRADGGIYIWRTAN